MDYEEFLQDIESLDFVKDEDTADAAIKAVLGMMSSSLQEADAKKITAALPEPLNISKLRGHQAYPTPLSFEDGVRQIAQQFHMDETHAGTLVNAILRSTRAALGGEKLGQAEDILSESWSSAIEHA